MTPFVLHVDLDQFLVAVERLRRPDLDGRRVIVGGGGDPTQRGVVSTASYEARRFGVTSGMPLRTAARRCPEAVFLPLDPPIYHRASEQVMAVLRALSPEVEVAGWDEAYLAAGTAPPDALARKIRRHVLRQTRLRCSVGIGANKLQAKIASGLAKPAGIFRLTAENWRAVMADRSPDDLVGIGARTARRLAQLGIRTVADLANAEEALLSERFGPIIGPSLVQLARGIGSATIVTRPPGPASLGREVTYQRNLTDLALIRGEVIRLADEVAAGLESTGTPVDRVGVTVRFAPFETHSHTVGLPAPGSGRRPIEEAALAALARFSIDRPIRLLGVRARLAPADAVRGARRRALRPPS